MPPYQKSTLLQFMHYFILYCRAASYLLQRIVIRKSLLLNLIFAMSKILLLSKKPSFLPFGKKEGFLRYLKNDSNQAAILMI